jgi:hypothetical protein
MNYIYHVIPKNLKGNILHPLNKLKKLDIDTFNQAIKKYEGREHLLSRKVPLLNVLWNDVVFFSSINPNIIVNSLNQIGFNYPQFTYIKVPVDDLNKSKSVLYHYSIINKPKDDNINDYSMLNDVNYKELTQIPKQTLEYFKDCYKKGLNPKLFVGIPHVLLADSINIDKYLQEGVYND